jgi:ubiquinone/menaquinone biosynthesis C-methylase UbiE|tara:strand:- start:1849 stop:2550 length:702 start_codon:yes stop_codon:yes gene_type:complete
VKKYVYLFISNLLLFLVFPFIRLVSKTFYEKNILPYVLNLSCNSKPIDYQRKKVIPDATGKVLEIGIGPGSNLKHYDNTKVTSILGIDPSKELNQIAKKRAEKNNLNIEFLIESASNLSAESKSIDTVVSTYALCSIPEPEKTLQEIKRVLKDDGIFIFSEHGLSPDKSVSFVQNITDSFYPKIAGGCHTNRHIENLIYDNGFEFIELNNIYLPGTQKFLGYNYWGKAKVVSK